MKENYYLSHNIDVYFDWLEEYQDIGLLYLWLKEQMYCCFNHTCVIKNIHGDGITYPSNYIYCQINTRWQSTANGYCYGSGMELRYNNDDNSYGDGMSFLEMSYPD